MIRYANIRILALSSLQTEQETFDTSFRGLAYVDWNLSVFSESVWTQKGQQ
jgi:hypothetical protein